MADKILFMIIGNEVKYLSNSNMDHREWYLSLGLREEEFDNIVRGFIIDGKIVFFKGMNFNYDQEVIDTAKKFSPGIRLTLGNPNLEVCCGIVVNSYGEKWEPVMRINDNELVGYTQNVVDNKEIKNNNNGQIESGPVIEFMNNYQDEKFIKNAVIMTIIILVLNILLKVILISSKALQMNNIIDFLVIIGSILVLGFCIYGYKNKISYTKYLGVVASLLLIFSFDIFDIILGIIYFVFSVDQGYFIKLIEMIKRKRG